MEPSTTPGELKAVRIIVGLHGQGVAEKLGIKPKDIVSLLLQRRFSRPLINLLNDDVAVELGQRFGYEVTSFHLKRWLPEEEFEELIRD